MDKWDTLSWFLLIRVKICNLNNDLLWYFSEISSSITCLHEKHTILTSEHHNHYLVYEFHFQNSPTL